MEDLTTGTNRAVIQNEPALTWMLPDLDAQTASLKRLVGNVSPDDLTKAIRLALTLSDAIHDGGHRFMFNVLVAFESRGPEEARAAVSKARIELYPNGLANIQVSFLREVADARGFANRLQDPLVRPGLDIVERALPEFATAQQEVLGALESMRLNLGKLGDLEADATSAPYLRELFDVRRDAQSLLSNFASTVEFAFRNADPVRAKQRDRLLYTWRQVMAKAAQRVDKPEDGIDIIGPAVDDITTDSEISPNN